MRCYIPSVLASLAATSLLSEVFVASHAIPVTGTQEHKAQKYALLSAPNDSENSTRAGTIQRRALSWEAAVAKGREKIALLDPDQDPQHTRYTVHYNTGPEQVQEFGVPAKYANTDPVAVSSFGYWPDGVLETMSINKDLKCPVKDIFSKEQAGTKPKFQKPVSSNAYCTAESILFANSNFRTNDKNPDADQLRSTEIMMQVWSQRAGDARGNLEWIVRSHIANTDTQGIIKEVYARTDDAEETKMLQITAAEQQEEFEALAGTPNCKGVFDALRDHYHEFGGLKITEFHIYSPGGTGGSNYFILIKLGTC
ncbi:uncharacterized protein N7459_005754 [Penicillium hispanicum]|uniref:uncharacterized protein n=1 Tax=Penicillium hispanicum TaxID=1080232 RepID=UPI0025425EDA|nr:uncharacterized protein N7459_005754 [Penicillium hispanicum]KAJ5579769.1 hypothetical protein N7459_005754 [Penicillium hispanicum]